MSFEILKNRVKSCLSHVKFINEYYSGIATIFMLHRVAPFEFTKLPINEDMKVSPKFMEEIIMKLKKNGFSFISLDELYDSLKKNIRMKKVVVFTFDDGYADNYDIAYPIFHGNNIPFTIYVTTDFPERKAILWWYEIEDLIIKHDEIVLQDGSVYKSKTVDEKTNTFLELRKYILNCNSTFESLNFIFSNYNIDWFKKCRELSLSWKQIEKLAKDSLVTIGNHTCSHYALNKLSKDQIFTEIRKANELLSMHIKKKVEHFSYPFGTRNEVNIDEFEIINSLGFKTATTTRAGNVFYQHKSKLNMLPRLMLTNKFNIYDMGKMRTKRVVTL